MRLAAGLSALLCVAALWGCGGGNSSSSGSTATSTPPEATTTGGDEGGASAAAGGSTPAPPVHHDDSGGGAQQFLHKGSDNSIQESGREASEPQFERAATALHGYLDAGAHRDWGSACHYLSAALYEQVAATVRLAGKPCPEVLEAFFSTVPPRNFALAAKADVGSFRVDGDHGFVLYRGAEGVDYSMPMAWEGGRWKVLAVAGSALP